MSFFWGHWYPCFGFLVTSPLGFKARVGSALLAIFAEVNVMYIPQDSPLVLHLPVASPHACAEVGLGSDSNYLYPTVNLLSQHMAV